MFSMARTDLNHTKTHAMRLVELQDPAHRDIETILKETLAETQSVTATAAAIGMPKQTVSRWIHDFGWRVVKRSWVEFPEDEE